MSAASQGSPRDAATSELAGRVAVVTGASGGIGSAIARLLGAKGADCVLVAREPAPLAALAGELGDPLVVPADLRRPEAAGEVVDAALARYGRIDILVNAAGAAAAGPFRELPDEAWVNAFELKVLGTVRMLRAVLPVMVAQGAGRVVNVAGDTGREPRAGLLVSAAANAALLALTKGVADEVAASGVTVNAVNPGPTHTGRMRRLLADQARATGRPESQILEELVRGCPQGRMGEPEEVAGMAVMLASDLASHVTGAAVTIDGGRSRGVH
jgi:3-oxoacyl-[acyl-carrier protein] reductase